MTADLKLILFSISTLEESQSDNFRFDACYWDICQVGRQ
jgi:hypothetical protein